MSNLFGNHSISIKREEPRLQTIHLLQRMRTRHKHCLAIRHSRRTERKARALCDPVLYALLYDMHDHRNGTVPVLRIKRRPPVLGWPRLVGQRTPEDVPRAVEVLLDELVEVRVRSSATAAATATASSGSGRGRDMLAELGEDTRVEGGGEAECGLGCGRKGGEVGRCWRGRRLADKGGRADRGVSPSADPTGRRGLAVDPEAGAGTLTECHMPELTVLACDPCASRTG